MATTNWQSTIERTVTGLDYELVDVERSTAGLLRVFIDRLPGKNYVTGEADSVNVEDCERVTRQLQYVLEVEGVAYERLEVSSPGLDRPLKAAADYERFTGHEVNLTLKMPFKGRKNYRGQLLAAPSGWRLALSGAKLGKGGKDRKGAKAAAGTGAKRLNGTHVAGEGLVEGDDGSNLALDFSLEEVREARLVPVLDFKGRSHSVPDAQMAAGVGGGVDGGRTR